MKIILAQLKKDIVSARGLFLAWIACVTFDLACSLGRLPSHPRSGPGFQTAAGFSVTVMSLVGVMTGVVLTYLLQFVLMMALVVRVVHADPLVEPNAFWRTRPIPRGALLGGKALLVALLIAGSLGASFALQMQQPGQSWLAVITFVSGLFALCAVTSNLTKVILAYVALAIGSHLATTVLLTSFDRIATSSWPPLSDGAAPSHSPLAGWVGPLGVSTLYLAGFAAVIVWQYLTLRTRISWWALGLTYFLAALLQAR